jgi:hypothetical protein
MRAVDANEPNNSLRLHRHIRTALRFLKCFVFSIVKTFENGSASLAKYVCVFCLLYEHYFFASCRRSYCLLVLLGARSGDCCRWL